MNETSEIVAVAVQCCAACLGPMDVAGLEALSQVSCPYCGASCMVHGRIGAYTLLDVIGRGGSGLAFRAFDENLQREVALKLMRDDREDNEESARQMEQEAARMATVVHANVVRVFTSGRLGQRHYLAMELVSGGTLDERMAGGKKLPELFVINLAMQAAAGLAAAQAAGLIHRDMKPGNILFERSNEGTAKVTDFGLATVAQNSGRGDGELIGTPHYLPPERVLGLAEDFRSDIYALGATLFHALAGRPLYDAATPGEIAMKHVNAPVMSVLTYAPGVSPSTATVLMKMLRKNPDERHASYEELIAEWQTVKEAVTQRVRNPQPAARLVLENAETQRTQFWFTMAFIGIVLVAGVVFYLMKKDPVAVEAAVSAPVAPPFTPLVIAPPLPVIPIVNASFEAPSVDSAPSRFSYLSSLDAGQGAALGWVGEGVVDVGAAVVHNGSPWLYAPAPEGEQCLSLQGVAKISQTIVFPKQGIYRLTWKAASRQGEDSLAEVQLDGGKVQGWMTEDPVWRSFSARLDVKSAGPHILSFATQSGSKQRPDSKTPDDTSVAIDQIGLTGPE